MYTYRWHNITIFYLPLPLVARFFAPVVVATRIFTNTSGVTRPVLWWFFTSRINNCRAMCMQIRFVFDVHAHLYKRLGNICLFIFYSLLSIVQLDECELLRTYNFNITKQPLYNVLTKSVLSITTRSKLYVLFEKENYIKYLWYISYWLSLI